MGEVLFLPVARATSWPDELDTLGHLGFETWALTPDVEAEPIWSLEVPERVALVLGAEGAGLSRGACAAVARQVRIPIAADVDSLNVGHAAAVAFAVVTR